MEKRTGPAKHWRCFYSVIYILGYPLVRSLFKIRLSRDPRLNDRSGSKIIIAGHQSYLDAVFIALAMGFRYKIRFVATNLLYRNRLGSWFMRHMGAIPIAQFAGDIGALRQFIQALKADEDVAVFPEGERTYDGSHTLPNNALLKLLHRSKKDLVLVTINGGYLSWPRWSTAGFSRGLIDLETRLLVEGEELVELTREDLHERLAGPFAQDDYRWQEARLHRGLALARFSKRKRAYGLADYIHYCPACKKLYAMRESKEGIYCSFCRLEWKCLPTGFLKIKGGPESQQIKEIMDRYSGPDKTSLSPQKIHRDQVQRLYQALSRTGLDLPAQVTRWQGEEESEPISCQLLLADRDQGPISYLCQDFHQRLDPHSLVYNMRQKNYVQFLDNNKELKRFYLKSRLAVSQVVDYLAIDRQRG